VTIQDIPATFRVNFGRMVKVRMVNLGRTIYSVRIGASVDGPQRDRAFLSTCGLGGTPGAKMAVRDSSEDDTAAYALKIKMEDGLPPGGVLDLICNLEIDRIGQWTLTGSVALSPFQTKPLDPPPIAPRVPRPPVQIPDGVIKPPPPIEASASRTFPVQ
jgi:hypothetical protein